MSSPALCQPGGGIKKLWRKLFERKRMPLWGRTVAMYLTDAMKTKNADFAYLWRDELLEMLLHKEAMIKESEVSGESSGAAQEMLRKRVPADCVGSSLTRAFSLQYLEWLPPNEELSEGARSGLPQFLILKLLEMNVTEESMQIVMTGTHEYDRASDEASPPKR